MVQLKKKKRRHDGKQYRISKGGRTKYNTHTPPHSTMVSFIDVLKKPLEEDTDTAVLVVLGGRG